jgi:choline dehydrogenase
VNPKARGSIKLKSSNPFDQPLINPNFLSNDDDIQMLLAGVKIARKVANTKPLSNIIVNEIMPGSHITNDRDLIEYCKKVVKTNWHPVGTCKMGSDDDELSVLNFRLQVKGINNLRVFDVSMMPSIVSSNTNAPAMAIADRATDLLLQN